MVKLLPNYPTIQTLCKSKQDRKSTHGKMMRDGNEDVAHTHVLMAAISHSKHTRTHTTTKPTEKKAHINMYRNYTQNKIKRVFLSQSLFVVDYAALFAKRILILVSIGRFLLFFLSSFGHQWTLLKYVGPSPLKYNYKKGMTTMSRKTMLLDVSLRKGRGLGVYNRSHFERRGS